MNVPQKCCDIVCFCKACTQYVASCIVVLVLVKSMHRHPLWIEEPSCSVQEYAATHLYHKEWKPPASIASDESFKSPPVLEQSMEST